MKTIKIACCSKVCERKNECARHYTNNESVRDTEDFYRYKWCGNRGNWALYEKMNTEDNGDYNDT